MLPHSKVGCHHDSFRMTPAFGRRVQMACLRRCGPRSYGRDDAILAARLCGANAIGSFRPLIFIPFVSFPRFLFLLLARSEDGGNGGNANSANGRPPPLQAVGSQLQLQTKRTGERRVSRDDRLCVVHLEEKKYAHVSEFCF